MSKVHLPKDFGSLETEILYLRVEVYKDYKKDFLNELDVNAYIEDFDVADDEYGFDETVIDFEFDTTEETD